VRLAVLSGGRDVGGRAGDVQTNTINRESSIPTTLDRRVMEVNGNWRVIFRFIGQDVELVNYLDYH
jgi:plasmid maintenance system killer protein